MEVIGTKEYLFLMVGVTCFNYIYRVVYELLEALFQKYR